MSDAECGAVHMLLASLEEVDQRAGIRGGLTALINRILGRTP